MEYASTEKSKSGPQFQRKFQCPYCSCSCAEEVHSDLLYNAAMIAFEILGLDTYFGLFSWSRGSAVRATFNFPPKVQRTR